MVFIDVELHPGEVEFYSGCMRSLKSEIIAKKMKHLSFDPNIKQVVIRPTWDTRPEEVRPSAFKALGLREEWVDAKNPSEMLKYTEGMHLIGLDEINPYSPEIVDIIQYLATKKGANVLLNGLDTDFRGEPYGRKERLEGTLEIVLVGDLFSITDRPYKGTAICDYTWTGEFGETITCGKKANRTQRFRDGQCANYNDQLLLPDGQPGVEYGSRCFRHHFVPGKPEYNTK